MKTPARLASLLLALLIVCSAGVPARADKAEFEYTLTLTDANGAVVRNPRELSAGSTLNVEIELERTDIKETSYETYGLEFRLMSRGLTYNSDGASFRGGTDVRLIKYDSGDSVGFAYYDMEQKGERIGNPVLAGRWSYTVDDPASINITVPVTVMYIVEDSESYEPIGNATLYLDPDGGAIDGEDVSGEYRSGDIVKLPGAVFADYTFAGWSDGERIYPAGSNYTVSGVVTLTAVWEDLVRSRQVIFEPQGGELGENDPSGMYADGEVITMPEPVRDGYVFDGWLMAGGDVYMPGDEWTVDNSVVFQAQWKPESEAVITPVVDGEDGSPGPLKTVLIIAGGVAAVGLGCWLWLILWKRRLVKYSLVNGAVSLDYKYSEDDYSVEAVLYDGEREYHLNRSGTVEAKHRLRFIPGSETLTPAAVQPGKYKGKLIVTDKKGKVTESKCRVKVVDEELREKK